MKHLILWLLLCSGTGFSQSSPLNNWQSRNTFFVEAGGKAWVASLNYERRFILDEKIRLGTQLGFAKFFNAGGIDPDTLIRKAHPVMYPFSINLMYGKSEHQLEAGLGITLKSLTGLSDGSFITPTLKGKARLMGTFQLGYRYHPKVGGVLFRANLTLIKQYLNDHEGTGLHPWAGISIGWALPNFNVQ